jgi:hypothetical protein
MWRGARFLAELGRASFAASAGVHLGAGAFAFLEPAVIACRGSVGRVQTGHLSRPAAHQALSVQQRLLPAAGSPARLNDSQGDTALQRIDNLPGAVGGSLVAKLFNDLFSSAQ